MVKENKDHYCLPVREIDLTILIDKLWQDTIHSGLQTSSELSEEWHSEFQDGYEILNEQEILTI